jgi:hypothetical protein
MTETMRRFFRAREEFELTGELAKAITLRLSTPVMGAIRVRAGRCAARLPMA